MKTNVSIGPWNDVGQGTPNFLSRGPVYSPSDFRGAGLWIAGVEIFLSSSHLVGERIVFHCWNYRDK